MTTTATVPSFQYEVLDASGNVRSGALEADSAAAAVARLNRMGYTPLSVTEKPTGGLHKELSLMPQRVRLKDLAIMSRQFATMIGAGLSLVARAGCAGRADREQQARGDAANRTR